MGWSDPTNELLQPVELVMKQHQPAEFSSLIPDLGCQEAETIDLKLIVPVTGIAGPQKVWLYEQLGASMPPSSPPEPLLILLSGMIYLLVILLRELLSFQIQSIFHFFTDYRSMIQSVLFLIFELVRMFLFVTPPRTYI
jgi:hypothetical protein